MSEKYKKFPRKKKAPESRTDGLYAVEGLSAVAEYLRFSPSSVKFVVYKASSFRSDLIALGSELADDKFIPAKDYKEGDSGLYSKSPVWACVKIEAKGEHELFTGLSLEKPETVLILDHITDPRNLGAIMRTAAFFGIKKVVAPKNRQVLLTWASVLTAQGAFALVDLFVVTNLTRTIEELKKRSFWVLGTSLKGKSFEEITEVDSQDNLALIMGSEEKGLSRGVEKNCDWLVLIDGGDGQLNSLNVSVAAGIFCDRIGQIRKKAKKNT